MKDPVQIGSLMYRWVKTCSWNQSLGSIAITVIIQWCLCWSRSCLMHLQNYDRFAWCVIARVKFFRTFLGTILLLRAFNAVPSNRISSSGIRKLKTKFSYPTIWTLQKNKMLGMWKSKTKRRTFENTQQVRQHSWREKRNQHFMVITSGRVWWWIMNHGE